MSFWFKEQDNIICVKENGHHGVQQTCISTSSRYVSSSPMYKPNNVGEREHPCLTPMLHMTSPWVSPLNHTFSQVAIYVAFMA